MMPPGNDPHAAAPPVVAGHELGFDLPAPASVSKVRAVVMIAVGLAAVVVAFVFGYVPGHQQRAALAEAADVAGKAVQRVEVVTPKVGASDRALSLPGSVQPLQETVLYARASGYVRKWYVDIGDRVTEGQVLADVETPELDQQIDQARAELAQAQAALLQSKANRQLSMANLDRYKALAPSGVVSQAELEQRQAQAQVDEATVSVSQAAIAAQDANMRRLAQLKSFSHVVSPFAGTVTQRWVEIGALVTAGNGQPLYKVAEMDPARVFTQVPQDVAAGVHADLPAAVTVREYPGRTFEGKVTRAADELDPVTRTMNTEVRVANADGALIAGMYAEVALTLPTPHRVFEVPATALSSDSHGQRVALVDADSRIHLVPVVVERDTGPTIEIASGLTGSERVVKLASADLVEGKLVDVTH
jgi:membrane fusion protein, multidrug efflux system